jgi:hypothetical protein
MAGTIFSGWFGRRSGRPYYDELPRLAAGEYKHLAPGLLIVTAAGQSYTVRLVRVPSGCMTAPRLICAACLRPCRVLYLNHAACCYRCAGARYRSHSESPMRRAVRRAERVWRLCKHDFKRPSAKPKWMRWPTYERLSVAANEVWPIIERAEGAPYAAIEKICAPRRKRGRPRKSESL